MSPREWTALAEALEDVAIQEFRSQICVFGGHFHLNAIGRCSRCHGTTSSCSMKICNRCAEELQVCPYDMRWVGIIENDRERLTIRWLALWMRGYSVERAAARKALSSGAAPEATSALDEMERMAERLPVVGNRAPVSVEFIVGFRKNHPVPVNAGDTFLDAEVLRVNPQLFSATMRAADAAAFELNVRKERSVAYVEVNHS